MITEKNAKTIGSTIRQPRQLTVFLPWILGASGLVLYLATLNRWISFNSLTQVAKVAGWSWVPELQGPLYWLVTLPIKLLPPSVIPLALNFLSAVCAALSLTFLARSVMLLPHDRTQEQRLREKSEFSLLSIRHAWLPPVMAVVICGLQLTFWEQATAASVEMLDLLVFSFVIRCLLEFRIDERQAWLNRAAFAYGLGMTNNWALVGFFPVFIMVIVWIKGLSFFNLRFLGQMALWGVVGMSLYFALPLVESMSEIARVPFWSGLTTNLGSQKGVLWLFYQNGRQVVAVLALTSLVPALLMGIKWASSFGDTSRLGAALATLMFHVVHGVFLVACAWVALDPPFSPRNQGFGVAFLTFYYLGSLAVGYFTGYFLLIFGSRPERERRTPPYVKFIGNVVTGAVWVLFLIVGAALLYRNLPDIRTTNGPLLRQYAESMTQSLPAEATLVLSDDPRRLILARSAALKRQANERPVMVDSTSLKWPDYHRVLRKQYGSRWLYEPPQTQTQLLDDFSILQVIGLHAPGASTFYLHPSFGYFFEYFYSEPQGLIYKLNLFPTNEIILPPLPEEALARNQAFWNNARANIERIKAAVRTPQTGVVDRLMLKAQLRRKPNPEARMLASYYSQAVNNWGVEMQRHGRLAEAREHFQTALQLNPDNVVAQINLDCNQSLAKGEKRPAQLPKAVEDAFGKYRKWDQVMGENGPFDEPHFCFEQGRIYMASKLFRQAAYQFDRAVTLAPQSLAPRLHLAQTHIICGMPDEALKLVQAVQENIDMFNIHRTNRTEIMFVEASAYLGKNDAAAAGQAVDRMLEKYPDDEEILGVATHVFMTYRQYSNAMGLIDRQLKKQPTNAQALVNKSYACIQLKEFAQSIEAATQALALDPNNHYALLNRAISHLALENLDDARRDYESLQKQYPTAFQVYYGLAEVAYRKRDTNAALRNYQLYLTNSPPGNPEANLVTDRLKELTPGSP